MTGVKGELNSKEKKKVFRVKEKIRSLSDEKKQREQSTKKLSFRLKKVERDCDTLQKKLQERSQEREELLREKDGLNTRISQNEQGLKKFIAAITFRSKEIEEDREKAHRRIHDIDLLVEKADHFIDKNSRKEEKLSREAAEIKRDLDLLNNEILGLHKDISETEKELKSINMA